MAVLVFTVLMALPRKQKLSALLCMRCESVMQAAEVSGGVLISVEAWLRWPQGDQIPLQPT